MAWDGHKMEEKKMRSQRLFDGGSKSRIHWADFVCVRALVDKYGNTCGNNPHRCGECFKYSEYIETKSK